MCQRPALFWRVLRRSMGRRPVSILGIIYDCVYNDTHQQHDAVRPVSSWGHRRIHTPVPVQHSTFFSHFGSLRSALKTYDSCVVHARQVQRSTQAQKDSASCIFAYLMPDCDCALLWCCLNRDSDRARQARDAEVKAQQRKNRCSSDDVWSIWCAAKSGETQRLGSFPS